jgi:Holliday junction resolvasome RuvABC endonuclease subunit
MMTHISNNDKEFIAGIDYSITSPAMVIHPFKEEWNPSLCHFFFASDKKKNQKVILPRNILGLGAYGAKYSNEARFTHLARIFTNIINEKHVIDIGMEDYSFASNGRVFHIGENTGVLKHKIFLMGIPVSVYAPSLIKKYATTKGNAKKCQMVEAFEKETGINLIKLFNTRHLKKPADESPVSDLADAYFICKKHYEEMKNVHRHK